MALDVLSILTLFGLTIVLGYIGSMIFRKTKVPDILWLMLFGFLVTHFGLINRDIFLVASPLLAALALLIILFDAGLNMDFYETVYGFTRSMLLGIVGFMLSMTAVAAIAMWLLGFDLLRSLLLGAMLGGTSSAIVLSIMSVVKVHQNVKTLITLESIITDPLCIVVSIALIGLAVPGAAYSPFQNIMGAFSVGAVVGLISGIIWLRVLHKLRDKPFDHMLTLAIVFLLYAGVEFSGGSGVIAALLFGLVLGNGKTFSEMLKMSKDYTINPLLKAFQAEISFFIRSFFFVYLGIVAVISPQYVLYGLAISLMLIVVRFAAVYVSTTGLGIPTPEKKLMCTMVPGGLSAAVLAQLPVTYGIPGAQIYSSIIFVVIFATVIYTAISIRLFYKDGYEKEEKIREESKAVEMEKTYEEKTIKKRRRRKKSIKSGFSSNL